MSLPVSLTTVEVTRGLQHISSLCSTALQQVGSSIYSGYGSGVCVENNWGSQARKIHPYYNLCVFTCLATMTVRLGTDLGSTYTLKFLTLSISERKYN